MEKLREAVVAGKVNDTVDRLIRRRGWRLTTSLRLARGAFDDMIQAALPASRASEDRRSSVGDTARPARRSPLP